DTPIRVIEERLEILPRLPLTESESRVAAIAETVRGIVRKRGGELYSAAPQREISTIEARFRQAIEMYRRGAIVRNEIDIAVNPVDFKRMAECAPALRQIERERIPV